MTNLIPLTCPNCGAPLTKEYECDYCGTRFRQPQPALIRLPKGSELDFSMSIVGTLAVPRGYPLSWP